MYICINVYGYCPVSVQRPSTQKRESCSLSGSNSVRAIFGSLLLGEATGGRGAYFCANVCMANLYVCNFVLSLSVCCIHQYPSHPEDAAIAYVHSYEPVPVRTYVHMRFTYLSYFCVVVTMHIYVHAYICTYIRTYICTYVRMCGGSIIMCACE